VPSRQEPPPDHVCRAFGADPADAELLPGGGVWRCGETVLKPVADKASTIWQAQALDRIEASLSKSELRIARSVRTTDGRLILGGWSAGRYLSGTPEYLADETVFAALKLHWATADLPRPPLIDTRTDVDAVADRIAWEELDVPLDETKGGRWFEVLAGARKPIGLPDQVVHGALLGNVLFDGEAAPGIVDFVPFHRPAEWGAAIVAVDAMAWAGADIQLLYRWSHLPEWSQLLLRAILFRLAAHALHPRSTRAALDGLRAAARGVSELV
jgi:uncharacterized protein (TIGR02569 family)